MKKGLKRILSALLSVMMLCAMGAYAAEEKITAKITLPNASYNGAIVNGYDEDGCQQILLEIAELGQLLIQMDADSLTAGNDETGYVSMDYENIMMALVSVINGIRYELPAENAVRFSRYNQDTEAMELDLARMEEILIVEANRFSTAAGELGFVTISETGDLSVEATAEDIGALLTKYAESLAADSSSIDQIFMLECIDIMGYNTPENREAFAEIPYMIMEAAEALAEADAGFSLNVKAEGSMDVRLYYSEYSDTNEITAKYDANGFALDADFPGNGKYSVSAGADKFSLLIEKEKVMLYTRDSLYDSLYFPAPGIAVISVNAEAGKFSVLIEDGNEKLIYSADNGVISYDYTNTDYGAKVKILRLNGTNENMKVYAKLGRYEDVVLNGTLRAEGSIVRFDGTFDKINGSLEYKRLFECEWDVAQGVFTADYQSFGESFVGGEHEYLDYTDKGEFRFEKAENGWNGKIAVSIEDTKEGLVINSGSVNARFEADAEDGALHAVMDLILDYESDENDMRNSASVTLNGNVMEIRISDGETEERIYAEVTSGSEMLSAGKSVTSLADGEKTDVVLFTIKSDLSEISFDNQETGAAFDFGVNGQTGSGTVSAPGAEIEFEYTVKESGYGKYIEFAGTVNGEPFSGETGVSVMNYGFTPYLELTADGMTELVRIPVVVIEDESGLIITAGASYAVDGESQSLFDAVIRTETIDDMLTHKHGAAVTAEEAVALIYELLDLQY